MKRALSVFMVVLLLTSMLTLAFKTRPVGAALKTWTVDDDGPADFHTIQGAINAAGSGDTIYVKVGTYHENVLINKAVLIVGENKNTTIIDGGKSNTITIEADNVTISHFTIRNGWSGIYSNGHDRIAIEDNIVTANIGTGVGDGSARGVGS